MDRQGFDTLTRLSEGSEAVVYRARRSEDGQPVVLKMLRGPRPGPEAQERFRREHELTTLVRGPGVVECIDLISGAEPTLVLADSDARSIDKPIADGSVAIDDVIEVGIGVAEALARVHAAGVVHQDISPSNVVWNPATGIVELIDFGCAIRTRTLAVGGELRSGMVGTLAYMAPEQSGRMNRSVDSRSDLYGLGATLFHLLTGRPPFIEADPLNLVHAHIARTPPRADEHRSDTPEALVHILDRLLAKSADDRYQTAAGLLADLEELRSRLERDDRSPFPLGTEDLLDAVRKPEQLFGRDDELATLDEAFVRSATGRSELFLVAGVSGIGKTRLINEIGPRMLERRATFVAGKHDQFQRGTPYAALVSGFARFVGDILSRSDSEVDRWRTTIVEAAGHELAVLVDVLPELALLVGEQPEPTRLPPQEAEIRFSFLVTRVIEALGTPTNPLVLFLDDLQWADHASMGLLQALVTDPTAKNVLVIGAYRDDEVPPGHPLLTLVDDIARLGGRVSRVSLGPLVGSDVRIWLADALDADPDDVLELAELLQRKSDGNPFFLERLIGSMAADGVISRDPQTRRWTWDLTEAQAVAPTDNVVDLLASALSVLSPGTQRALGIGALLGERFDLRTLSDIGGWSLSETAGLIDPALLESMLSRVDDSVALETRIQDDLDPSIRPTYRFAHDRVQQAARELLDPSEIDAARLDIARQLRDAGAEGGELFDMVEHALAASSVIPAGERHGFAELAQHAGRQASLAAAFEPALRYFEGAWELLGADPWDADHELARDVALGGAEAAYLHGDQVRVDAWTDEVIEHCTDLESVLGAHDIAIQALNARNELIPAIERAVDALRLVGIRLPSNPKQAQIVSGLLGVKRAMRNHDLESLRALPDCEDPVVLAALRIQMRISVSTYYARPDLLPLLAFNMVRDTLRHGVAAESPFGFAVYGLVLCAIGQIGNGLEAGEVAVALNERSESDRLRHRARHLHTTHLRMWSDHWRDCRNTLRETHRACWNGGDLVYAAFGAFMSTTMTLYTGDPLDELERTTNDFFEAIRHLQNDNTLQTVAMTRQMALCLSGRAEHPQLLRGEAYHEGEMFAVHEAANDGTNLFVRSLHSGHLALIFDETDRAVGHFDEAEKLKDGAASTVYQVAHEFYAGLANAAASARAGSGRRASKALRRLRKWQPFSPANHDHRVALLEAEIAAANGRESDAIEAFERAISSARINAWHGDLALASERAARFHLSRGHASIGRGHLLDARHHYAAWGAHAKVEHLDGEFSEELRGAAATPAAGRRDGTISLTTTGDPSALLDTGALIDAATVISTERNVDGVVDAVLRKSVEVGGASRGALVMNDDDGLRVHAIATADRLDAADRPLDGAPVVVSAISLAARTLDDVVVDDVGVDERHRNDPHVAASGVRSVLAVPIVQQQRLVAVLYLENDLTTSAFPDDRVATLKALTGQAAVSLQNARLYESLEQQVRDRTAELVEARQEAEIQRDRADSLLVNVLPEPIADELKRNGRARPVSVPEATVLFTDFKGFTTLAETMSPEELVGELATVFTVFDRIVDRHGIEKLKTIGDAYMAAGGVPTATPTHAVDAVRAALDMAAFVEHGDAEHPAPPFEIRIGLHSGPLVAGVIGERRFLYDVWGDTVNTAARMESSGLPGRVNISAATHELVTDVFECTPRGLVEAKGKGTLEMWLVDGVRRPH